MSRVKKRATLIRTWGLILAILLTLTYEPQMATASAVLSKPCVAIGDPSTSSSMSSLNLGYFDSLTQTFKAKHTASVTALEVYVKNDDFSETSEIGVDFMSAGTVMGQANGLIQVHEDGWIKLQFSAPISIVAGQEYAVKVYRKNGSKVLMLGVSVKDYGDGIFYVEKDTVRQINNEENMRLRLYMSKGDPSSATSNLSSLTVADTILGLESDPDNLKYRVIVLPGATSFTITPSLETPADSFLEMNGKAEASGAPYTISVNEGVNEIVATAIKGDCSEAKTYTVLVIKDTTAPTLTWTTTPQPNAAGWFKDDVTVHWDVNDSASGIDPNTIPSNPLITGEGNNLSVTATVKDKAGNSATATAGGIKIDRTAPVTTISLSNGNKKVTLTAVDSLSGVKKTYYQIDDGDVQTGSAVDFQTDGTFTLKAWSEDVAGNVEQAKTMQIRTKTPAGNGSGGNSNSGNSSPPVIPKDSIATAVIPAGASGEVDLGNDIKVSFPANASDRELRVTIKKRDDSPSFAGDGALPLSTVYTIELNPDIRLQQPALVSMRFDAGKLADGYRASMFRFDEQLGWIEIESVESGGVVSATMDQFGTFALFGVKEERRPVVTLDDIQGHWAEDQLYEAVVEGIISGYPDNSFRPDRAVSRQEFTVMLMRAIGPQTGAPAQSFTDGEHIGDWARQAIADAARAGIISGYEDGSFRPDESINRAEMVAVIARALQMPLASDATTFADDADIPDWAKGYVAAAVKSGIVNGRSDSIFAPNDTATRGEAAVLLLRLFATMSRDVMP